MGHLLQKIIWKFLKKTKYRIILWSSNDASGYIHKRTKDNYALMFVVALSTRAKSGNTRPSADEGTSRMQSIHTMGYFSISGRKQILTRFNMSDPWGQCAPWDKPITKGQAVYHFIHEASRELKLIDSRKVGVRGWGRGRKWRVSV